MIPERFLSKDRALLVWYRARWASLPSLVLASLAPYPPLDDTLHRWVPRILVLVLTLGASPVLGAALERLVLNIGDVHELQVPAEAELRLSQKRIVEIEEGESGRFRLLALRSGLVTLRVTDRQGQLLRLILLEIMPRPVGSTTHLLQQEPWQSYFCKEDGIRCDPEQLRIEGLTRSLRWFHAAKRQCERFAPCRFEVKLSQEAQSEWAETLTRELARGPVLVSDDGFVQLQDECADLSREERENLRRLVLDRYGAPLYFACRPGQATAWVLEVLALAQRSQHSELDNPLEWEFPSLPPKAPLGAVIRGLNQDGRFDILAQPEVLLTVGSEVSVRDGLEIQTLWREGDTPQGTWKPIGFVLQGRLIELRDENAKLHLDLQLSRARSGAQSLDSSRLSTDAWVQLEQWQRIGRVRAHTDTRETSGIPWLKDIPWVGALFQWELEQTAASNVWLYIRLLPALASGEAPQLPDGARFRTQPGD